MKVSTEELLFTTLRGKRRRQYLRTKELGQKALLVSGKHDLVSFESFLFSRCWGCWGFTRIGCSAWLDLHDSAYHNMMHAGMEIQAHG